MQGVEAVKVGAKVGSGPAGRSASGRILVGPIRRKAFATLLQKLLERVF